MKKITLHFDPFIYFSVFLLANILLDYAPLPLTLKLWVLFFGILAPLGIGIFHACSQLPSPAPLGHEEVLPPSPRWIWLSLLLLAVSLRLTNLGAAWSWPYGDQSLTGMVALELTHQWSWALFQTFGQIPTLYSWMVYALLHSTHLPFFSLYFPNALFSILTVGMGWLAARQYFSKSFSLILLLLLSFSAVTLRIDQLAYPTTPAMFWQLAVFYVLGRFLKAEKSFSLTWTCALGALCGCGPYTGTKWPILFLFAGGVLFLAKKENRVLRGLLFTASSGLFLLPFLVSFLHHPADGHILKLAVWRHFSSWGTQCSIWAGYFQVLLGPGTGDPFTPSSLGFSNCLLVSFFYLGVIDFFRRIRRPFILAILFGFSISLLPGLLTTNVEGFRILSALPFFLVITISGIRAFLDKFLLPKRIPIFILLLTLSALFNIDGFFQIHQRLFHHPGPWMKTEQQIGYSILRPIAKSQGPGYIFWGWAPEVRDFSLAYATNPFNAAWNPQLKSSAVPRWTALLTESHYLPWLRERFPHSQWFQVKIPGKVWSPASIGIIPNEPDSTKNMAGWLSFNDQIQNWDLEIMNQSNGVSRHEILLKMLRFYPSVPLDPYLQSCFFEKLAFNYSCEQTFDPEDTWACWANFSAVFQKSFHRGTQDPVLKDQYQKLAASGPSS